MLLLLLLVPWAPLTCAYHRGAWPSAAARVGESNEQASLVTKWLVVRWLVGWWAHRTSPHSATTVVVVVVVTFRGVFAFRSLSGSRARLAVPTPLMWEGHGLYVEQGRAHTHTHTNKVTQRETHATERQKTRVGSG
uniref:Putative secreted protein n=1 Tax=Anopheles triannulatus TaxID=58253 RepID=A0A2M4B237_9DIPT